MSDLGHRQRAVSDRSWGVWHYLRRLPAKFANLDKRGSIKLSAKIKVARDKRRRHRERMINPQRWH
jgi:hypothetical protein